MKFTPYTFALFVSLAAVTAGCGESNDGYVSFEQTTPSLLDQPPEKRESASEVIDKSESESLQFGIKPVSAVNESNSGGVNHAVSTEAAPLDEEPVLPIHSGTTPPPASNSETTGSSPVPGLDASIDPLDSSAASKAATTGSTTDSVAVDTSLSGSAGRVVSGQSGLAGPADNPLIENAASSEPRKIELLIAEKAFRKERGSRALRLTYDDLDLLKILNMEPVPADAAEYFPEWLTALNGKSIRIRGFMYPTFEATGLTSFTLARDNGICCFVRQPKIYDIIAVRMADGVTSDYIEGRPFDVEGVLRIEPQADEKDLSRLYRIEDARVLR